MTGSPAGMQINAQEWSDPQCGPYLQDTDLALDLKDHILILIFPCRHGAGLLDVGVSKSPV